MSPAQCRMARAALQWTIKDLEEASTVSFPTISNFENGQRVYATTVERLRAAFESKGIVFVDENGLGAGVHMPKAKKKKR